MRAHRHLFVPLADLEAARDALARRIKAAKLAANPLYVDLDDDAPDADRDKQQLDELRAKRRDAEARLDRSSNVSADGKIAMIQIRTAFRADRRRPRRGSCSTRSTRCATRVIAAHPGVADRLHRRRRSPRSPSTTRSSTAWCCRASSPTLLVALVLALYFRSATLLVLLVGTLAIATAAAFGAAALTVGHLNAATAFLGAIIAGNGVNYGILLIARYLEERRRARSSRPRSRPRSAARCGPTAVASLGASIAYGSLAATSFKGFADFAVIGAIGMVLCWIATLRAAAGADAALGPRAARRRTAIRWSARCSSRVLGFRRPRVVCARRAASARSSPALIVVRYVADDPFEYDIKQLRSEGADAVTARDVDERLRQELRPRLRRAARSSPPTGSTRSR